jgi:hypothetical protein
MSDWRSRLREGRDDLRDTLRGDSRDSLRERTETSEAQTVGALINDSVRKLVTAIVVAGGLIGIGAYASGTSVDAPRYQVTTTPDGRIIRVNTDSGTVIVCEGERCGIVLQRGQDLDDAPPPRVEPPKQDARPALPAPAQSQDNQAAAPARATAPTPAPTQR